MDILTYGLLNKKIEEAKNVSGEKITEAVNTYLDENPPTTGATAEQAAQIDKNESDISELKSDLESDIFDIDTNLKRFKFYEETVVPSSIEALKIEISGYSITVTPDPTDKVLFAFENTGSQVFRRITTETSYTIPNNSLLVVNRTSWSVEVKTQQEIWNNRENYILLVWSYYGQVEGQWSWLYYLKKLQNEVKDNVTYQPITNNYMSRQGQFVGYTSENTIYGIKYAKSHGYNNIRLSVCFTSDGYGILSHFDEISSLSGVTKVDGSAIGNEKISELTQSTILNDYLFHGLPFVKLEDAIKLCKEINLELTLELKTWITPSSATNYTNLILAYGMNDFVWWSDASIENLNRISTSRSDVNIAYITRVSINGANATEQLTNTGKRRIDGYADDVFDETVWAYVRNKNLQIKIGSVTTIENAVLWAPYCDILECANIEFPAKAIYKALEN